MMRWLFGSLLLTHAAAAQAASPPPRAILEQAIAAHGGEGWLEPGTLELHGSATFYAPDSAEPRRTADDYRMWRIMDPDRQSAHGADGKVRIVAREGDDIVFEVGYDGETTWTEGGIMPKPQADAYWASNFGFGIIRSALHAGFTLQAVPPREHAGTIIDMVRIIDPQGQATLFGFDPDSHFIRYMAFDSPRGFHERHYADFIRVPQTGGGSDWVQAREVTLYYDGVRSNTVHWRDVAVGKPIDPTIFMPPRPAADN